MPRRQKLAEFDYILIGAICRGFTTGYSIRQQIVRTRGQRWSGSTGAVYPALRRLEGGGYLEVVGEATNEKRARTVYHATKTGKTALKRWLMATVPEEDLGMLSDPLRSRALNLRLLTARERPKAVDGWIAANEQYISYFREALGRVERSSKDPFVIEGFHNMAELLEGRRRWLQQLASVVGKSEE